MKRRRPKPIPLHRLTGLKKQIRIYEIIQEEIAERKTNSAQYESDEARRQAKRPRPPKMDFRTCPECGGTLIVRRETKQTCSAKCRQRAYRLMKHHSKVDKVSVTGGA